MRTDLFIGGVISLVLLAGCSSNPEFPFLEEEPEQELLMGSYVLHPQSIARLKGKNYPPTNTRLSLLADKTFEASSMPYVWMNDGSLPGFDTCWGTWSAGRRVHSSSVYYVHLRVTKFSPYSTFMTAQPGSIYRGSGSPPLMLGIADRTEERPEYSLAVPLNYGDEGYLILVKE